MSRYCFLVLASVLLSAHGATAQTQTFRHVTENFVVFAPDPTFARQVGSEAERFRRELAIQWLDQELPRWSEKCPIQVALAAHSGGETSFRLCSTGNNAGSPWAGT